MLRKTSTFYAECSNLAEYLKQYNLTEFINCSDDSDFQDTTYETHIAHENCRKQAKANRAKKKLEFNEFRKRAAFNYYLKHRMNPTSIFNQPGITFEHYNQQLISMIFNPAVLKMQYICTHRDYHVKLRYRRKYWILKRNHTPNRTQIYQLFDDVLVVDDNLIEMLFEIYKTLLNSISELNNFRKTKYKKFIMNPDIELYSDEEVLFLTEEEVKKRRDKVKRIWSRMLDPNYKI